MVKVEINPYPRKTPQRVPEGEVTITLSLDEAVRLTNRAQWPLATGSGFGYADVSAILGPLFRELASPNSPVRSFVKSDGPR